MSEKSFSTVNSARKTSRTSFRAQAALAVARRETLGGEEEPHLAPIRVPTRQRLTIGAESVERAKTAPGGTSTFKPGRTRLLEVSARHQLEGQRRQERQPLARLGPQVQARMVEDDQTFDESGLVQYSSLRSSTVLTCTMDGQTEYSDDELSDNSCSYKCSSRQHAIFLKDHVYIQACSELHVHPNSRVRELLTRCSDWMCFCDLEVVSFRNCMLGDRGLLAMLPLLTFARALRCLNLVGNGMREGSLRQLVSALLEPTTCSGLLVLDLSQNSIPHKGAEWLLRFLPRRRRLLLLGLADTGWPEERRKRLMMKSLGNFCKAPPADMLEAWRLSKDDERLADRDLWLRCDRFIQRQDSKVDNDALAKADTYVEADSANVMSGEQAPIERRKSMNTPRDERWASMSSPKTQKLFCPWWEQLPGE